MTAHTTTGLYWFRHDLRVTNNPSFNALCAKVDWLICVYCIGQDSELLSDLSENNVGKPKQVFEYQSAQALDTELRQKHQYLLMIESPTHNAIVDLVAHYRVTHIGASQHPGVYEKQSLQKLKNACPNVEFISQDSHCLFQQQALPFVVDDLPVSFTPFRKKVESLPIAKPILALDTLPKSIEPAPEALPELHDTTDFQGGAQSAHSQLNTYLFATDLIKTYKQTRNALDDWNSSSKLSFWLANGCISARCVYHTIKQYEAQRGANESTYWLYFELLWREYFQWYLAKHQNRLFDFAGVRQVLPTTSFNQQQFIRWCEGMTDYPIVNACMRQLNQTGYMSNRGRQLVASCFVHELGLDWRYGAAYFEQQLIDYDVASNWGNWQYLAGVGADPRGHRRFDLQKQTQTYDPDGTFRDKWLNSDI
jgi:deoxyribodipyrimidine photo-lyase